MAAPQKNLDERTTQAQVLQRTLDERVVEVQTLQVIVQEKDAEISALRNELSSIKQSLIWRATMRFQSLVDRLLPLGSRRRFFCDLALTGMYTIRYEGWRTFARKGRMWLGLRLN